MIRRFSIPPRNIKEGGYVVGLSYCFYNGLVPFRLLFGVRATEGSHIRKGSTKQKLRWF